MVDEPKNEEGVQSVTTPSSDDAITEKPEQPDNAEPAKDYQKLLEEAEAKAKRYKEQLQGREKQVEELQNAVLAKKFFSEPEDDKTSEPQENVKTETKEPKKQLDRNNIIRDQMLIKATIKDISENMASKYGSDKYVPFNAAEVKERILEADPGGLSLLNEKTWDYMYKVIRGEKLDTIAEKFNKEKEEIQDKEDSKMVDTPSVPTNSGNEDNDRLPFEKAVYTLSSDELKRQYPDEYAAAMRNYIGI